ncbi:hypothetical protein Pan216_15760 [Planctomycetes bacterium Pan216]|uniref:Uncharacterized protein n=1 Tax=Kolteria novifilia TaxID=2527975 RepID=A0A518B176_9BACT|nr:hypothetical protein Pan216_15760 [Planctomycetes bacterium Pan216]
MIRHWRKLLFPAFGVVAFVAIACGQRPDLETARKIQSAQENFDKAETPEEYLRSAGIYQDVSKGITNGAVLYNQGNAFMRAGERGRAVASYREAERYRPRDPYLQANLDFARGTSERPRKSVFEHVVFWQNWLSYPEKFTFLGTLGLATFALGMLSLFDIGGVIVRRTAWAGLVVTCVLAVSATYDWYRFDYRDHGVVTADEVVARKGNAETYAPAFTDKLDEGTEFVLLDRRGDWLMIKLPGGPEGWIKDDSAVVY